MAEVLKQLGSQHVMVVHAADGLDEISIASETYVVELRKGVLSEYTISPEQFNLSRGSLSDIQVETATESLKLIQQALRGETGSAKNIIALNAGAALYVSGIANNVDQGVKIALDIMDSGKANLKLQQLINQSNRY